MPDVPVIGVCTGQGSGEMQNEHLAAALSAPIGYINEPLGPNRVWLFFGNAPKNIQTVRDNGWLTEP